MNKQWEKMDDDYESVITRVHVKYHEDRKNSRDMGNIKSATFCFFH